MRIGKRLRGSIFWTLAMTLGMAAGAHAGERARTVPLGGTLDRQTGDHYYGVYVPTRFGGESEDHDQLGASRRAQGAERHGGRQWPGRRSGSPGLVHLQGGGGQEGLHRRDQLRPGRPEPQEALELLLLAHEGRLDPRALGRRQWPGRHLVRQRRRSVDRHARVLHRPGAGYRRGRPERIAGDPADSRRRRHLVPQPV